MTAIWPVSLILYFRDLIQKNLFFEILFKKMQVFYVWLELYKMIT